MAGTKDTLFNVGVHPIDIDGETYSIKEMSAKDYISYTQYQTKIDADESINERSKSFYGAALLAVFSLVDSKRKPLFDYDDYELLIENVKADRLMTLSVEIMRVNGMLETEEDAAKNS